VLENGLLEAEMSAPNNQSIRRCCLYLPTGIIAWITDFPYSIGSENKISELPRVDLTPGNSNFFRKV